MHSFIKTAGSRAEKAFGHLKGYKKSKKFKSL